MGLLWISGALENKDDKAETNITVSVHEETGTTTILIINCQISS